MYFRQFVLNGLNLLDHTINFILLGDSDETVSARTARARIAGHKWAVWMCETMTEVQKIVTLGKVTRDHCDYALDKSIRPNSAEIWNWNHNKLNPTPISEVQVLDDGNEC
jgi:hypothetical protein